MQGNNVLFLDMDGVINGGRLDNILCLPMKNAEGREIDATIWSLECIQPFLELMKWCKSNNISIVISSTWRIGMTPKLFNEYFQRYFDRNDIADVVGVTNVRLKPYMHRGREIEDYLLEHPEIERYICVDDSIEDIAERIPGWNIYQTSVHTGLTNQDIIKIKERWNKLYVKKEI